ncbi:Rieske (2Fe-2S) protein [Geomicrobium sp. JCM 19039]|uniref:Rieske (2Fe-2S) protein n=1 Tax=Geomicrobium sp. JCM 19039 TaxID=1460636 RepID=UPI00045F24D3|nr:Rieske (2Fe-2S) protein [Geomicrobium sp. JCM 19039]GAK12096.1 ferredoxin reductase [Geomicrobium sp. JCM 19039]
MSWQKACSMEELKKERVKLIKGGIVVLLHEGHVYAIDNRCPHMGFPLHMGSLKNGILTCQWHHARFDVSSGGTLDPWADDLIKYETDIQDEQIYVNVARATGDRATYHMNQLQKGLEQNLSLLIGKGVVGLLTIDTKHVRDILHAGIRFGTTSNNAGFDRGVTTLVAMVNVLPKLHLRVQVQALYQALVMVASDGANRAPKRKLTPLTTEADLGERWVDWYTECTNVRDAQGAERILLSAMHTYSKEALAQLVMRAVTEHYYMNDGHVLDFTNKAFEAIELCDEAYHSDILASLPMIVTTAERSEEKSRWRAPVDYYTLVEKALEDIQSAGVNPSAPLDDGALLTALLESQDGSSIQAVKQVIMQGVPLVNIARVITLAAATRIVHFSTQNDFDDWNTVLHTFSHAHAVHASLQRSHDPSLIRAMMHTVVSLSLDSFLNIPAAKRPVAAELDDDQLHHFLALFDTQQPVEVAAQWALSYSDKHADTGPLFAAIGEAMLREDAGFHTLQMYEAATVEYDNWNSFNNDFAKRAKDTLLIALVRYVAAHSPTPRELPRFADIAWRLHRGEKIFEEA